MAGRDLAAYYDRAVEAFKKHGSHVTKVAEDLGITYDQARKLFVDGAGGRPAISEVVPDKTPAFRVAKDRRYQWNDTSSLSLIHRPARIKDLIAEYQKSPAEHAAVARAAGFSVPLAVRLWTYGLRRYYRPLREVVAEHPEPCHPDDIPGEWFCVVTESGSTSDPDAAERMAREMTPAGLGAFSETPENARAEDEDIERDTGESARYTSSEMYGNEARGKTTQGTHAPTPTVHAELIPAPPTAAQVMSDLDTAMLTIRSQLPANLLREQQIITGTRETAAGILGYIQRGVISLGPAIEEMVKKMALRTAAYAVSPYDREGGITSKEILKILGTYTKLLNAVAHINKQSLDQQRIIAGVPTEITEHRVKAHTVTENRGGESAPTTSSIEQAKALVARLRASREQTLSDTPYSGESGGDDAIDLTLDDVIEKD